MLYFSIQNARGGREKSPRLRGGLRTDGFMVGSCSDHARIGRALEMTFHPFSANFFEILDAHFSWQAQYLVSLDYDACCSALRPVARTVTSHGVALLGTEYTL